MAVHEEKTTKKLRIGFIHPDLGIGGAERFVVDAAVSLQKRGHEVVTFTSRHDSKRCFEETRNGTLQVHVLGSSLPMRLHPRLPLTIVFSILRSLLLTILLLFSLLLPGPASPMNPLSPIEPFDVFVVDQQSVCVPLLRWISGSRVVFYCHFPDKLLSPGWTIENDGKNVKSDSGLLRKIYRWPVDRLEEWTTGQSDVILANSRFTANVYDAVFPSLAKRGTTVVYPCIDLEQYSPSKASKGKDRARTDVDLILSDRPTLLSLNRFEKKKNIALAVEAFGCVRGDGNDPATSKLRLVLGGGFDDKLVENAEVLRDLQDRCNMYGLEWVVRDSRTPPADTADAASDPDVVFLLNFSTAQRTYLLTSPHTKCLLYTPTNEHFGIVPIEAGACGLPVLATDTGGPLETVLDPETGLLRNPTTAVWEEAIRRLVDLTPEQRKKMAETARTRVKERFSLDTLGREMESSCQQALDMGSIHSQMGDRFIWAGAAMMLASGMAIVATWWAS